MVMVELMLLKTDIFEVEPTQPRGV